MMSLFFPVDLVKVSYIDIRVKYLPLTIWRLCCYAKNYNMGRVKWC